MSGVTTLVYKPDKPPANSCHPFTYEIDAGIRIGLAVAEICRSLQSQGIRPDLIIGHNGWGETLFVKDVFPDIPLLSYFEFYYRPHGADVNFDPAFPQRFDDSLRLRIKNATNHIGLDAADCGFTPTNWQKSL